MASPKSHNSSIVKYETPKWKYTNTEACSQMGIKYEKNEQIFLFLKELKEEGHLQWLGGGKIKHLKPTCKAPDCLHNLYQLPSREGLMQESSLTAAGDGNGAICHR